MILIVLSIIWGSSYILIKKSLVVFPPTMVATLRLSISTLAFAPFLVMKFKKINWSQWPFLLIVGLTGTALPAFFFSFAQTQISSSVAGLLNSLTPLFTLVLGVLLFKQRSNWGKLIGVLIGLIGAAALIVWGKEAGAPGNPWYGILVVFGAICYAISSNTVGSFLQNVNTLIISAVSFCMVGFPAVILFVLRL